MKLAFPLALAVILAGCGRSDPVARNEEDAALLPAPENSGSASPTGAPQTMNAAAGKPGTASAIPPALLGRWGLTPGDCTSTRGDAKGLLTIAPGEIAFYESRGIPADGVQTSANSISGNFDFTGEGQKWVKHETLEVRRGLLVRTERDPSASFSYVRC